jgi:hypothetical protein
VAPLAADGRFERLLRTAKTEPPRARALIGALCEALGIEQSALERLRRTVHSPSRFDFGASIARAMP